MDVLFTSYLKKIICFALSLLMVFTVVPMNNVYAEESVDSTQVSTVSDSSSESKVTSSSYIYEVDYYQKEINKKDVTIDVPNADKLISLGRADSVKVEANLFYKDTVMQTVSKTVNLSDIETTKSFDIEFPTY